MFVVLLFMLIRSGAMRYHVILHSKRRSYQEIIYRVLAPQIILTWHFSRREYFRVGLSFSWHFSGFISLLLKNEIKLDIQVSQK